MKRLILLVILGSIWSFGSAQTSLSFYHLGAATFQSTNYNPAYMPGGKVLLGLPVLSGIHLHYNNKFSYQEIISRTPEGNPQINVNKAFRNMGRNNMIATQVDISLFHLAFRMENGSTFSFFANERIQSDILLPRSAMEVIIKGNGIRYNKNIDMGKIRANATHFREIGVGYTLYNEDLKLTVGARLKYLQGFFNASTPLSQKATLRTDSDTYGLSGTLSNAMLRTSGIDILKGNEGNIGSHLAFNGNSGLAMDFGFLWEKDRYNAISVSLVDLGYISWKEDIKNYSLTDTTFSYGGIDLKNPSNVVDAVKDSLINKFKVKNNDDAYTTILAPKIYASWMYHINPYGDVVSSIGARFIQGQMKTMLGVGYQHRLGNILTGSINLTKLPQQFFNVGAAFAARGGPVQLYVAVDQVATWDMTHFQSFDARVGINFVFHGGSQKPLEGSKGLKSNTTAFEKTKTRGPGFKQSQSFMGSKIKVKRQEGIYNIIPLQKRRELDNSLLTPEPEGNQ